MTASELTPTTSHLTVAASAERVAEYVSAARSPATRRAYNRAWRAFVAWARARGAEPMPTRPEVLAAHLAERADAGAKVASLSLLLAAVGEAHRIAGHESPRNSPLVRETWKGIKRRCGTAQRRARPTLVADLRAMVASLPTSLRGLRDRAVLVVGFAGAFRRSELVALDVADVELSDDGLVVTIRRSKTDQEGAGAKVGLPYGGRRETCPVRCLRAWLEAAGVTDGPLFRSVSRHGKAAGRLSGHDVSRVVKAAAEAAGLDSSAYSGHSLRAGLATSAAKAGRGDRSIMKQGRWRSRTMVDRYVRDASLFDDNACNDLGL